MGESGVPDDLDEFCTDLLRREALPSLTLAIGAGGEVVDARAYGYANLATGTPATVETPYLLASVTKPITATAVLTLVQEGRLDLDAPAESYLDGLRLPRTPAAGTAAPTVGQLLSHTGGLGTYWDFYYEGRNPRPPSTQTFERYATLFREPGSGYEYSNLGYGLVDAIVARVTGEDPADAVVARALTPVGATSGRLGARYRGSTAPAERYSREGAQAYPAYDSSHRGASLAWLSAPDLVRFGLSYAGGPTVLDAEHRALAHRARTPVKGDRDGTGYGLGWGVRTTAGRPFASHGGDMGGVGTVLGVAPDPGLAVAVLVNRTGTTALARRVSDHVLAGLLDGYEPAAGPVPVPRTGPPLPLGHWAGAIGTHRREVPVTLDVTGDGAVTATVDGGPAPATVHDHESDDTYPVRITLDVAFPADDGTATPVDLCVAEREGVAAGAARAVRRGEVDGLVGDCRSLPVELRLAR